MITKVAEKSYESQTFELLLNSINQGLLVYDQNKNLVYNNSFINEIAKKVKNEPIDNLGEYFLNLEALIEQKLDNIQLNPENEQNKKPKSIDEIINEC